MGELANSGSSPRVRGTDHPLHGQQHGHRFIPARAGNGALAVACGMLVTVHPRACGERSGGRRGHKGNNGSSPRVRGTGLSARTERMSGRFIPARAGNGPRACSRFVSASVHPRACGERGGDFFALGASFGSSPRVRGTVAEILLRVPGRRFIPARAGNGSPFLIWSPPRTVHPRACGERLFAAASASPSSGSSPRVRGTIYGVEAGLLTDGSSPRVRGTDDAM